MQGVDISSWQGDINYDVMKASGARFIYIRATIGASGLDNKFVQNCYYSARYKIPRASYHLFKPERDPIEQANHFHNILSTAARVHGKWDFAPAVDVEWVSNVTQSEYEQSLKTFLETYVSLSGWTPVIYTRATFWNYYIGGHTLWANDYPLWVAHWGVDKPSLPGPWKDWLFWQSGGEPGKDYGSPHEFIGVDQFNGGPFRFFWWSLMDKLRARYRAVSQTKIF